MRVVYVHLPRFPVQRKVLESPSWKGQPFVLAYEQGGVRRVAFASASALRAGVHPGMVLTAAQALIHPLEAFPYETEREASALSALGEMALAAGPAFELSLPDGFWLDASAAPLWGGEPGLGARVIDLCNAQGYRTQVAIASNRFTARCVARHAQPALSIIPEGESRHWLRAYPLTALDSIEPTLVARLRALGLSTMGEVAALPLGPLTARLGAAAVALHGLCRGEDSTPLTPASLALVIEESLALDWPAESMESLLFSLKTLVDRVCARLSGRQLAAVHLTLKLILDPQGEASITLSLARPTSQSKMLLDLLKHRLADKTLTNPIGRLVLKVDETAIDRAQQQNLGDEPQGDAALEVVLSRLASRLGEGALFCAQPLANHRPETAYAQAPFRPARRETGLLEGTKSVKAAATPAPLSTAVERPIRLLASAVPIQVEMEGNTLRSGKLWGQQRAITHVRGPERLQGEWWSEQSYARDYYRAVFEGLGTLWIFRDARDGQFYWQGMFD